MPELKQFIDDNMQKPLALIGGRFLWTRHDAKEEEVSRSVPV